MNRRRVYITSKGKALFVVYADRKKGQRHTAGDNMYAMFSPPCDLSNFYQSLAIQLIESGSLSPRQAEYALKAVFGRKQSDAREAMRAELTGRA